MVIFSIGGALYSSLELLWRGWTHGSMFAVGGACFWLIGGIDRRHPKMPFLTQMVAGTGVILTLELTSGLLLNRVLHLGVWDYSHMPGQVMGQICLPFALLWLPVSGAAIVTEDYLRHWLFREQLPQYRWV